MTCGRGHIGERRGSVLMETVLVLPLLLALVGAIAQGAIIWNALIMTNYAAFNAARATLVYHPAEYREIDEEGRFADFRSVDGVCWEAAAVALQECGLLTNDNAVASTYLRIRPSECAEDMNLASNAPTVKVTVEYDCLLAVPAVGPFLASLPDPAPIPKEVHPSGKLHYITLTATGVRVKPYLTTRFARRPAQ